VATHFYMPYLKATSTRADLPPVRRDGGTLRHEWGTVVIRISGREYG
jgi:hypothetical protein